MVFLLRAPDNRHHLFPVVRMYTGQNLIDAKRLVFHHIQAGRRRRPLAHRSLAPGREPINLPGPLRWPVP